MAILLQPRDTFRDHYKSSLQARQDTWEHFTLTLAPSTIGRQAPIQLWPSKLRLMQAITMTMHRLCIKLDTSNPTGIEPLLPLQPCAFSPLAELRWVKTGPWPAQNFAKRLYLCIDSPTIWFDHSICACSLAPGGRAAWQRQPAELVKHLTSNFPAIAARQHASTCFFSFPNSS
jgi:hypothetical protein